MEWKRFHVSHLPAKLTVSIFDLVIWNGSLVSNCGQGLSLWNFDLKSRTLRCTKTLANNGGTRDITKCKITRKYHFQKVSPVVTPHETLIAIRSSDNALEKWGQDGTLQEEVFNEFDTSQQRLLAVDNFLIFQTHYPRSVSRVNISNGLEDMRKELLHFSSGSSWLLPVPSQQQLWIPDLFGFEIIRVTSNPPRSFPLRIEEAIREHQIEEGEQLVDEEIDLAPSDNWNPIICEWKGMVVTGVWKDALLLWKCETDSIIKYRGQIPVNHTRITSLFSWNELLCVESQHKNDKRVLDLYYWDAWQRPKLFSSIKTEDGIFRAWGNFLCEFHQEARALTFHWLRLSWNVKKQLLIGWMKHPKEECVLASLPKDLLKIILEFVECKPFIGVRKPDKFSQDIEQLFKRRKVQ